MDFDGLNSTRLIFIICWIAIAHFIVLSGEETVNEHFLRLFLYTYYTHDFFVVKFVISTKWAHFEMLNDELYASVLENEDF